MSDGSSSSSGDSGSGDWLFVYTWVNVGSAVLSDSIGSARLAGRWTASVPGAVAESRHWFTYRRPTHVCTVGLISITLRTSSFKRNDSLAKSRTKEGEAASLTAQLRKG